MTPHIRTGERIAAGRYLGFDHITFWVGNAKQAASYYVTRFGFEPCGYKGLETGSRAFVSHAVRQNDIVFIFQSSLEPGNKAFDEFASKHGDGVKDVAITVDDCRGIWKKAVQRGARNVRAPFELKDEFGSVIVATVSTGGDVEHTFIQRTGYAGPFLPGFITPVKDPLTELLPATDLLSIDHCVVSVPENEMTPTSKLYDNFFDFRRFWSIDDKQVNPKRSIRQSIVMTDYDEMVKMPINEPTYRETSINERDVAINTETQEFVKYNAGAGVQRVALKTNDIIKSVSNLRARGVEFMPVAAVYYSHLTQSLETAKCNVVEPLAVLEQLGIRVDSDNEGYLLQIFTKPLVDRPTLEEFLNSVLRNDMTKAVVIEDAKLAQTIEELSYSRKCLKYVRPDIFDSSSIQAAIGSAVTLDLDVISRLMQGDFKYILPYPSDIGRLAVIESTKTNDEDLDGEGNQFYTQSLCALPRNGEMIVWVILV
ncbi:hypothetical protein HDU77_010008 [Chytriomyces hyalinus]|nr:hypothetical protein HDU77_010008 [Chytriomyces hyalinus]